MTEEERPAEVEETPFRRRLRHTHRSGLWVAALGALAVLVYLILLIVENSHPVTVHFVFGTGHTREQDEDRGGDSANECDRAR